MQNVERKWEFPKKETLSILKVIGEIKNGDPH